MKAWKLAIALLMATPAFGFEYRGDGDFSDRGIMSATRRYRLILPVVNLCETGEYSFAIGRLPAEALFLNLEYAYPKNVSERELDELVDVISDGVVGLSLEEVGGSGSIYKYEGRIYEQKSGRGFPGIRVDFYGWVEFRVVEVRFHKGFFWQRHTAKRLRFSVISPVSLPNCFANFVITGGGWQ